METTNTSTLPYEVDEVPKTLPIPSLIVSKFKELRLEALLKSPSAFLSSHAREAAFTNERWIEEITDPTKHFLICHTDDETNREPTKSNRNSRNSGNYQNIQERKWVGVLILQGPLALADYSPSHLPDIVPSLVSVIPVETRWHFSGLYLQAAHRCRDSTVAIHEAILASLRMWTDAALPTMFDEVTGAETSKKARLAGFLRSENAVLEEMYLALDGKEVGFAGSEVAAKIAGINGEELKCEHQWHGAQSPGPGMRIMERVIEC